MKQYLAIAFLASALAGLPIAKACDEVPSDSQTPASSEPDKYLAKKDAPASKDAPKDHADGNSAVSKEA